MTRLGSNWLGGQNYFRSLFWALVLHQSGKIKVVLIVGKGDRQKAVQAYPMAPEIIETPFLSRAHPYHLFRHVLRKLFGWDILLDRFLKKNQINIISHGSGLGRKSSTPSIVWIPDFQHIHLKEFFSSKELAFRDRNFKESSNLASQILVSSQAAQKDCPIFLPGNEKKISVLNFVPHLEDIEIVPLPELQQHYPLPQKFIFFPGQLWIHKNHLLVLAAVAKLRSFGNVVNIVSTGAHEDFRHPEHKSRVLNELQTLGLQQNFLFLGVVPYSHLLSLLFHSHALLNPSLFEGWSTTVEEGKLFDKKLILSDIPVHREQTKHTATFFDPNSSDECASALWNSWLEPSPRCDLPSAKVRHFAESEKFAENYTRICSELVDHH